MKTAGANEELKLSEALQNFFSIHSGRVTSINCVERRLTLRLVQYRSITSDSKIPSPCACTSDFSHHAAVLVYEERDVRGGCTGLLWGCTRTGLLWAQSCVELTTCRPNGRNCRVSCWMLLCCPSRSRRVWGCFRSTGNSPFVRVRRLRVGLTPALLNNPL